MHSGTWPSPQYQSLGHAQWPWEKARSKGALMVGKAKKIRAIATRVGNFPSWLAHHSSLSLVMLARGPRDMADWSRCPAHCCVARRHLMSHVYRCPARPQAGRWLLYCRDPGWELISSWRGECEIGDPTGKIWHVQMQQEVVIHSKSILQECHILNINLAWK